MDLNNKIVLNCAFRYALGRSDYVTSAVSDVIIDCWDALDFQTRITMVHEIEEAIKRNEAGMYMDIDCWKRIILLSKLNNDALSERGEKNGR